MSFEFENSPPVRKVARRKREAAGAAFGDTENVTVFEGQWTDVNRVLKFAASTAGPYGPATLLDRAIWETSLFDLRSSMGGNAYNKGATDIGRDVLFGNHLSLYVDIDATFVNTGLDGYRWYYVQKSVTVNPRLGRQGGQNGGPRFIHERQDITTEVYSGTLDTSGADDRLWTSLVLPLHNPIRYWGAAIVVDYTGGNNQGQPVFKINAALH